jgi:hypothetical protein
VHLLGASGMQNDKCAMWHPNGKSRQDKEGTVDKEQQQRPECFGWRNDPDGCRLPACKYAHPNGKHNKDAPKDEGEYNKRDLTPVGKRHTPVDTAKYIYDKGEPAKGDPKAAEAHARNSKTRVKVRDPQSD